MKLLLSLAVLLYISTYVEAGSNWRNHTAICGGNKSCMMEQAKAQDLWSGQSWDRDLKSSCETHIEMYSKDYISAVNCVYSLQIVRQDYKEDEARIRRDNSEAVLNRELARSLRRW